MKLDLLAMAAHPDDVELTCGGTLIKMARLGYRVGILDLTAGEMGTRGSRELRHVRSGSRRARAGRGAPRKSPFPDAHLELCMEHKLAVARRIRALRRAR